VDDALESIANGEFDARVDVPNRDEFGHLTSNLNRTTEQLATVYGDLETLNADLQTAVDVKVGELERATRLKRYLSPQLADSILSGSATSPSAPGASSSRRSSPTCEGSRPRPNGWSRRNWSTISTTTSRR
jgi:hypothetical protein